MGESKNLSDMKADLTDTTFLILVRLDSIERLENVVNITQMLLTYFDTHVIVMEADNHSNGVLKKLLPKRASCRYFEDKDPVLYKTKLFNRMTQEVSTPYLSIWDADIVPDKKAIMGSIDHIRNHGADMSFPYAGLCYNVTSILKDYFLHNKDIRFLYRQKNKMDLLYEYPLVGGAVFVKKESYLLAGAENEKHYGWGNDDFDRYYRFAGLGLNIYRAPFPLFHLSHPRSSQNSHFSSGTQRNISSSEKYTIESCSRTELLNYIK